MQHRDHFLVFFPILSQTIMQSLLCIARVVEKALFHKRRIRQINTGSEIFSVRISLFHRAFYFTIYNGPTNALVCSKTLIQMLE
jgi:hypothetical protein